MDKVVDFTQCPIQYRRYGGSDKKFAVLYDNEVYMLKFSEDHAKKTDISTSYVNNVVSEYISSHIAATIGLPVHDTVLGTYNGELVVGCKDFRNSPMDENIEFSDIMRSHYDSSELKRLVLLNQIYDTLDQSVYQLSDKLIIDAIDRYWDTFVVDALVGNFDRHMGNWGFIANGNTLRLAPTYDYGSTLFPQLSDEGMMEKHSSFFEMAKRCLVFPSPSLVITKEKVGKIGYYDMLSSNYDGNCTAALLRMQPRIDMEKIYQVIDNTPLISDIRKVFYKDIVSLRKVLIIDAAYQLAVSREYDNKALSRLQNGQQYTDKMLDAELDTLVKKYNINKRDYICNQIVQYDSVEELFEQAVCGTEAKTDAHNQQSSEHTAQETTQSIVHSVEIDEEEIEI